MDLSGLGQCFIKESVAWKSVLSGCRTSVNLRTNALTGAAVAAENFPFTTIEPNVGVVPLPDGRLSHPGPGMEFG